MKQDYKQIKMRSPTHFIANDLHHFMGCQLAKALFDVHIDPLVQVLMRFRDKLMASKQKLPVQLVLIAPHIDDLDPSGSLNSNEPSKRKVHPAGGMLPP